MIYTVIITLYIIYSITDDVSFLRAFTIVPWTVCSTACVPWTVCSTACVPSAHALEKYRDKSMLPHNTRARTRTHTQRNRTTNVYPHLTSTRPARRYVTKIDTRRNKQKNWQGGSGAACNEAFNSVFTAPGAASDIKLYYTILLLHYTLLYYTILILYYNILHYTTLYYTILILYYTIIYCTTLHYTILYYYYTILYYTNTILY